MWTTSDRLYLNSDKTKVVPEGSPEAKFLLCAKGQQVSDPDCQRYGLGAYAPARDATTDNTQAEGLEATTGTEMESEGPQNGSQDAESGGNTQEAPEVAESPKPRRRR